jgi:hypothetical protein
MTRPSFHAPVQSTLSANKLPPTDHCILEYVVDDGPGLGLAAFGHLAVCFLPCWFALQWSTPAGDHTICYYILGALTLTTLMARVRGPLPMSYTIFLVDVAVFTIMSSFPAVMQIGMAFLIQIGFAWRFAKHYIYLRSASPSSPEASQRCRQAVPAKLFLAFLLGFTLLPISAVLALFYYRDSSNAFVSFLTYNWGGNPAAGIFHSPAGSWRFRVLSFHATVMALTTAFANTGIVLLPFPWVGALLPIVLYAGCLLLCWLPALLTLILCQSLLAPFLPFLPSRQEVSHDFS